MAVSREELLEQFSNAPAGTVRSLEQFAYIRKELVARPASTLFREHWGRDYGVLKKYLAVYIRESIKQGRYLFYGDQLIVRAGYLQTPYGAPVYLGLVPNKHNMQPWYLNYVGSGHYLNELQELPEPPTLPTWPELDTTCEVTISDDHVLRQINERFAFLNSSPEISRVYVIMGAVYWSIHRNLQIQQIYMEDKFEDNVDQMEEGLEARDTTAEVTST